jgi:hypothetical protein
MVEPAPGFPNWVDLGTSDLAGATAFYSELFGWTARVSADPAYGGYTVFTLGDAPVAGAGPLMSPSQPATWSSYFATSDADGDARRVEAAGGKVLVAPFDAGDEGRMAVFHDPAGAPFSVWQGYTMPGAGVLDAPGALCWSELVTRDVDGSRAFYGAVFGWSARAQPMGDTPYLTWEKNGRLLGGLLPMTGPGWPVDLPPHWMVYFAVVDCATVAAHAVELGGSVSRPPTPFAWGRYAILRDPQGAAFSVLEGGG